MSQNIFAVNAIHWIRAGYAIFPCVGKIPLTQHGYLDASRDPNVIAQWSREYPNANIGMPTGGTNGIIVVDIDGDAGAISSESLDLPETTTVRTGRGLHKWYAYHPGVGNRANLLPGIDIRGDGGYVIVPPSFHSGGTTYHFMDDYNIRNTPLSPFPDSLIYILSDPRNRTPPKNEPETPAQTCHQEGERNDKLYRLACSMRAKDIPPDILRSTLMAYNSARCSPPLNEKEVHTICDSACKFKPGPSNSTASAAGGTSGASNQSQAEPPKKTTRIKRASNYIELFNIPIRYNLLDNMIYLNGETMQDYHKIRLEMEVSEYYGVNFGDGVIERAILEYASRHSYDSMVEEFRKLEWDGVHRLDLALSDIFELPLSPYLSDLSNTLFRSIVHRAVHPGCPCRFILVLQGPQGIGKSRFCSDLALRPEWLSTSLPADLDHERAPAYVIGKNIIEIPEFKSKRKTYIESLKDFLSRPYDDFARKWQETKRFPRRGIFIVTTNEPQFLPSGDQNSRFYPLRIESYNHHYLSENLRQIYAEALQSLSVNPTLPIPTPNCPDREEFIEENHWVQLIEQYALGKSELNITNMLTEHFKLKPHELNRTYKEVANALLTLGFKRSRSRQNGTRVFLYKRQI
jgi:virulence-associated protein E/bifunctional DNA primase/polymerase-like protein/primase-like protein